MSSPIIIRGTLSQILDKLDDALAIIDNRRNSGFPIKQPGHTWRHITREFDVCEWCLPLHRMEMDGSVIDLDYPGGDVLPSLMTIQANYHDRSDVPVDNICHCVVEWVDPQTDLSNDLSDELRVLENE